MFSNYLKVAWRNLKKNKVFSFINIFSLAIGLTSCILITLYINHELSYDDYHKNKNELYQLGTTFVKNGEEERSANTPAPLARFMQQEFPEIKGTARLLKLFLEDKTLFQLRNADGSTRSFYETDGFIADSGFFNLLSYNFIEGDKATALQEPRTVVLTQEMATRFFGKEPALNKMVHISSSTNGDYDFKVTGVYKPTKLPSHINATFFLSLKGGEMEQYMIRAGTDLVSNNMYHTYLLLQPGTDAKKLEAKFPAFLDKYAGKDLKAMGMDKKQFLTPIKDVYLYSNTKSNVSATGSITYLYILGSIALLTLVIACINFMNLSTARSSRRSAEVGVRKVLGAEKQALFTQFLGESLLLSFIAFVIAIAITFLLLPLFSQASGKSIAFSFAQHWPLLIGFVVMVILTGLLAGSYPAFYLSSFKPVKVLKGKFTNSLAAASLRKGLVVFQFVISVVLIIASVVISNQMQYMRSADLGFNKEQQLIIPLRSGTAKQIYTSFKTELSRNPNIKSVGASAYYPGIDNPSDINMYKDGLTVNDSKRVYMNYVDDNFMQTLGIAPAAGRLFSKEFPSDTASRIIFNEEGIKQLGFATAGEAIGKSANFDWQGETYKFEIVGVVKNFHFKDLHLAIEPYAFRLNDQPLHNYMIAHVANNELPGVLKSIDKIWHQLNPNEPFEYSFLDQDFQKNYIAESRLATIVAYFTIIAILISCLGLFGLATFSAEQRTKEIGVRKVLGASVGSIVTLLSKDFLKLVGLSIIIASPIAWYAMNKWLQDFEFRITVGWHVFLVTAVIALFIAILTISFQAIKSALSNPIKSLRTE